MLGIMNPVANAIASSPRLFELNRMGGAEYIHPRRFATRVMIKNSTGTSKKMTIVAAKTFEVNSSVSEIFFATGESLGFSTKIFFFEKVWHRAEIKSE